MRRICSTVAPGRPSSRAEGSSMKSVFSRRTERMRRPGKAWRKPRATVSTSGSSGIFLFYSFAGRPTNGGGMKLRKRDAGRGDDAGHAQDLRIFFFGERANGHAGIFPEFNSAQELVF